MKNKNNWYLKVIKRFYGIRGVIDEYQIQEINRIGNNAFIFIVIIWPILMMMDIFLIYLMSAINALLVLFGLSFLTLIVVMDYVVIAISRLYLDDIDSYDENDYHKWVHNTKRKAIFGTITFFLVERIFGVLFDTVTGGALLVNIISLKKNLIWLIGSILFGISMYYLMKSKIKKP